MPNLKTFLLTPIAVLALCGMAMAQPPSPDFGPDFSGPQDKVDTIAGQLPGSGSMDIVQQLSNRIDENTRAINANAAAISKLDEKLDSIMRDRVSVSSSVEVPPVTLAPSPVVSSFSSSPIVVSSELPLAPTNDQIFIGPQPIPTPVPSGGGSTGSYRRPSTSLARRLTRAPSWGYVSTPALQSSQVVQVPISMEQRTTTQLLPIGQQNCPGGICPTPAFNALPPRRGLGSRVGNFFFGR